MNRADGSWEAEYFSRSKSYSVFAARISHRRRTVVQIKMADNVISSCLDAALAYAARGWAVLPIRAGSKVPLTAHAVKDASRDPRVIRGWWERWPKANVGIACGAVSGGLIVVDCDVQQFIWPFEKFCGPLPDTYTVATGHGSHRYLIASGSVRTQKLAPRLEIRGEGSYVLAPPSRHPSGARYCVIADLEPVPVSEALLQLLQQKSPAQAAPKIEIADDGLPRVSSQVRELVDQDPQVKLRWAGDPHGLSDSSKSGIDLSLASLLVHRGCGDAEIADALRVAPYNARRQKKLTHNYLARTVAKARSNEVASNEARPAVGTEAPARCVNHGRESAATLLLELGREHAELFHSGEDCFATFTVENHQEIYPLRSRGFRAWLTKIYFEREGRAASGEAVRSALTTLEGFAVF